MEDQHLCQKLPIDYHANVDTSRAFSSVKQAVAIFGERLLAGDMHSPKPHNSPKPEVDTSWSFSTPSPMGQLPPREEAEGEQHALSNSLKKLEAELAETKLELKLLKERESETEVALASLNAELHKNMSRLARAEAAAAAKAAATRRSIDFERGTGADAMEEQEKMSEMVIRMENSPTLAQILSISEMGDYSGCVKEKKMMKKKPIIPLVGDWFSRKKRSPTTHLHEPLYSSPHFFT
ncbi:WEB family protein At2g17940 [Rhodamnia argentea]|uniref:WEB family protein At2g17940 n=1 Tax=Rhodamnia argentea TaxID=178133 RepID=A0A8B8PX58_9MYRT|nr:WEB family protein At2g17940 [Rhodamnia argentea]